MFMENNSNQYIINEKSRALRKLDTIYVVNKSHTDMENVINLTGAGFFISNFCPKVSEIRQFHSCDKTA